MADPEPIERRDFEADSLMRQHPPRWRHPNKGVVFEVACPPGSVQRGTVGYTRWEAMVLPSHLERGGREIVDETAGFFDYRPVLDPATGLEWHLNFADAHLFVAYGGGLFAQDEMQVAEHPALGALREALLAAGSSALTVKDGAPTPVLVTGVERRVSVATDPDAAAGRPDGLYGNAFARAGPEVVQKACARIDPPTMSNILAISAPPPGYGAYRRHEVELTLVTAYSGFRAAVLESARLRGPGAEVAVHTGYWGCGAFGGNRVLMALLQVVAARLAGVNRLVFHTGAGGEAELAEAMACLDELAGGRGMEVPSLLDGILDQGFKWGVSDGN